jgi:GT2 family glycosyltransferase
MTTSADSPTLSVIIVNYNGGDELLACLKSLRDSNEFISHEALVIDNDSRDGSFARAKQAFSQFKFISAGDNVGFAAANNIGLRNATGRHVLLLNPDTEIESGALSRLVSALEAHPEWGIIGPRMLDGNGKPYRAARRFPTTKDLAYEQLGLSKLFPLSRRFNGYVYGETPLRTLDEVEQIEGSALLIRREALDAVGPLDEQFFIFFEEVDWCRRVRDAGFEIHVVADAAVRHHRSTTMSKHYVRIRRIHANSAMKYFRKHHGEESLRELRKRMKRALRLRILLCWLHLPLGGFGKALLRAQGASAELDAYQRGLPQ